MNLYEDAEHIQSSCVDYRYKGAYTVIGQEMVPKEVKAYCKDCWEDDKKVVELEYRFERYDGFVHGCDNTHIVSLDEKYPTVKFYPKHIVLEDLIT